MFNNIKNNDFTDIMKNRRSIRQYDKDVKISDEEMNEILLETTSAPSSVNMQPWRFVVVKSDEGKKILEPIVTFNKTQNETSSAMICIFEDMQAGDNTEKIHNKAVDEGLMDRELADKRIEGLSNRYNTISEQDLKDINKLDCGLAAMQLMLVARAHGYDTCPIGGFDKENIAEALGIDKERYVPAVLVSIGKADSEGHESVRLELDDVVLKNI